MERGWTRWSASVVLVGFVFAQAVQATASGNQNVRLLGQIGGACYTIQVVGNYAYVGEGTFLQILDVSNPSAPAPLGRLLLPALAGGIFVSGNLAYVANDWAGLQIVDVSNPLEPTILGTYSSSGWSEDVYVFGNLAYVADGNAGLLIVDVGDPAHPVFRGTLRMSGTAENVQVVGSLAYLATGYDGLKIIDVTNPSAPALVGAYLTPGPTESVQVVGSLAYVADSWNGLQVLDVTDPTSPILHGSYATMGWIIDVYVLNNLAYLAGYDAGLLLVDVSTPSSPTTAGSYDTPGEASAVLVSGGLAYVADGSGGVQIIDVSTPSAPQLRGAYTKVGQAEGLFVRRGLAYVAGGYNGLQILDVRNPSNPRLLSTHPTSAYASNVFVAGSHAYIADYEAGLQIFDVGNPLSPVFRGFHDTPGYAEDVYVVGGLAYVADGSGGLQVIDVSDPAQPAFRGSFPTAGWTIDVWVSGGMAYMADEAGGLQIVDVSDPTSPVLRGQYPTAGIAENVWVSNNLAYFVDGNLQILDVSNPSSPFLLGSYLAPSYAEGVAVSGHLAFLGTGEGLVVVDVADPGNPVRRGLGYIPNGGGFVDLSGGLAYVTGGETGLWIFEFSGGPPRIQTATLSDADLTVNQADQLVLTLDQSVVVTSSVLRASHFFLPVAGDSLGGTGFSVDVNPHNSRQIVLTLGAGPRLTPVGRFSTQTVTGGSPSAIDFATSLPPQAIVSLAGVSVVDGGLPDVDDSGLDVEYNIISAASVVGPAGGTISLQPFPDAAYKHHELRVPAGALTTATLFRLLPPTVNLGVIGAVHIDSTDPATSFAVPARIVIEYRQGDVDFERGYLESEMKIHRLVEIAVGRYQYRPVIGPQTLRTDLRRMSVAVTSLTPPTLESTPWPSRAVLRAQLGSGGVFAGLPIETVDEKTINIKPDGGGAIRQQNALLTAGARGAYTLHSIEFPGYSVTGAADPLRLVVTVRTATSAERVSTTGGQSFPSQSGAIFVVTIEDASGNPVAFTDPVNLTVQFKRRSDPSLSDVVRFDNWPGLAEAMQLASDVQVDDPVDFQFTAISPQAVDTAQGAVSVDNLTGLTAADGKGTWGAVARRYRTPARRWLFYR